MSLITISAVSRWRIIAPLTVRSMGLRSPWLPDAQARMARGLPACGDRCDIPNVPGGTLGARVMIKNGAFETGPFSFGSAPLGPGVYPIKVTLETGDISGVFFIRFTTGKSSSGRMTGKEGK